VVLTVALWKRFHPEDDEAAPPPFYILRDPAVAITAPRTHFAWSTLESATIDAEGNMYLLVHGSKEYDSDNFVASLDARGVPRWAKLQWDLDAEAQLVWRSDGTLLLWSRQWHSAHVLRASDGEPIGRIGGKQDPAATTHSLDLYEAFGLLADGNATLLLHKEGRLARCAPDGHGVTTWPARSGVLVWFSSDKPTPFGHPKPGFFIGGEPDEQGRALAGLGDHPTEFTRISPKLDFGWDGSLYIQEGDYLAKYDRNGVRTCGVKLPFPGVRAFGGDANGNAYLLDDHMLEAERPRGSLYRVSPAGEVTRIVDGSRADTPIHKGDARMLVRRDGTCVVLAKDNSMRVFASDGRPLFRSEGAAKADAELAAHEAKLAAAER
jgi:hypothetical protein